MIILSVWTVKFDCVSFSRETARCRARLVGQEQGIRSPRTQISDPRFQNKDRSEPLEWLSISRLATKAPEHVDNRSDVRGTGLNYDKSHLYNRTLTAGRDLPNDRTKPAT